MSLRIDAGGSARYCDGLSRRSFVQLGVAGMASLGLGDILRAKALSASSVTGQRGPSKKSVILIWLDGGPSHLDLYDLKPEASAEIRGLWRPIRTNVPGFEISELFPRQAQIADKFSIVRSLYHGTGDHFGGGHRMLTGKEMGVNGANQSGRFPSIGSIVARERGANRAGHAGLHRRADRCQHRARSRLFRRQLAGLRSTIRSKPAATRTAPPSACRISTSSPA